MANQNKPNILILRGDNVGWWNISSNSRGQMGCRTPTSIALAKGAAFTDLLRTAELQRRPLCVHHRPEPDPHRPDQGGMPGADIVPWTKVSLSVVTCRNLTELYDASKVVLAAADRALPRYRWKAQLAKLSAAAGRPLGKV
jgi:hypothetical protein